MIRMHRLLLPSITLALITSAAASAAPYDDRCVLLAAKELPASATVSRVETTPAMHDQVRKAGKDPGLNWTEVTFTVTLGGRQMNQAFICAPVAGRLLVVAAD
jgi:hypothetical protein